ncbi:RidA family protein [Solirubrobacter sp. CPCC 204708]|uniref:RidA family protein n=1 Tax=Solirubrobacter deserti TaxID=2282478 RepID=A0ABT4RK28_9ACTN|nr:RidA family protein [Solirubrobacter deserti]MBE2315791.1 RidA family protein [Solirubrobacter deserti]MDA0138872.1 RidA family protein [Solirubrobacter deserti]
MSLEGLNPPTLATPDTYTQVMIAEGRRLVFISGQVAEDRDGNFVGAGDLAVQAREAFANVGRALAAAGARPDEVAKLQIFVVGLTLEHLPVIEAARVAVFGDHKPADTLLGVAALGYADALIEVEAVAVLDRQSA